MQARRDVAPWIEAFARVGFVAKGLLYAMIGILAGAAGMGHGGETTDTRGAMSHFLDLPFGRTLLVGVAIGLVGYAVWRIVEGVADPGARGSDAKGLAVRGSFIARGAAHLWLAFAAATVAIRHRSGAASSGGQADKATAQAFALPSGEWLVWGAAVCIAAFGAYQVYRACISKLNRDVDKREVENETGSWLIIVSRVGIAARGIVFIAISWLLSHAARDHDPSEAGGIGDALDALAQLGQWPFVAIAAGLIAYGAYQLVSARYRRIDAS